MKVSRRLIIIVVALVVLVSLSLPGLCLWELILRPSWEREQRKALATSFLEAYDKGDCAGAKALLDPTVPLTNFHEPDVWNPQTFCREYGIKILQLDRVTDPGPNFFTTACCVVHFNGGFEVTDYGTGPYYCSEVIVDVEHSDNGWMVTGWSESNGDHVCVPLNERRNLRLDWPQCYDAPGVSLQVNKLDNNRIELVANGLETHKGSLYIFYGQADGEGFRGEVGLWQGKGGIWVEDVNREFANINPMVDGRLVYTLRSLPPLSKGAVWEVRLAHPYGVACAQLTLP